MSKLVLSLSDKDAANAELFGPKAANQAALGLAGLPIPSGFCVSAEAYRIQLRKNSLLKLIFNSFDFFKQIFFS